MILLLLLLLGLLPAERALVQASRESLQYLATSRTLASTTFANGNSRDGALIGYTEEHIRTPSPPSDVSAATESADSERWCKDADDNCESWAEKGECDKNPDFMSGSCMRSCGACAKLLTGARKCPSADECQRVFFDVEINQERAGRIVLDLFTGVVPKTAENFRQLTLREDCGYKGTRFHRIIPGFMNQGGQTCKSSIYGSRFNDENFHFNFDEPYLLAMANGGPNTNNVDYFITVAPSHHLDGKFVVLGTVVSGFSLVRTINTWGTNNFAGGVHADIRIVDTGELPWEPSYL